MRAYDLEDNKRRGGCADKKLKLNRRYARINCNIYDAYYFYMKEQRKPTKDALTTTTTADRPDTMTLSITYSLLKNTIVLKKPFSTKKKFC